MVAWDASSSLRRFYLARTAEDLESRARLAEDQIVPLLAAKKYAEIDALCKELGKRSATRLTVILPDGKVVGDSLESPQEMDNHALRPEVVDALDEDKGKGVSLRYSETLKQDLRYVAVPARDHGQTLGVVRAAVSLSAIDGALGEIRSHILVASLLTAVLLAVASLIIARRFVKPLEQLSHDAEWFARRRPRASAFERQFRRKSAAWPRRSIKWPPTWKTSSTRSCGSGTSATPFSRAWWKACWPSTPTNASSA